MKILKNRYWFKKSDYQTEALTEKADKNEIEEKKNKKLYCINCKLHITDLDLVFNINGSCIHTFTNPSGFVYTVNCYQVAQGCVLVGEPTEEYTWFKGYRWQIVMCQSCQLQLGWFFSNSESFYAFIEDRLTQFI